MVSNKSCPTRAGKIKRKGGFFHGKSKQNPSKQSPWAGSFARCKETKEGKDKASKKLEKAENNTKKAWKKLDAVRDKKYDAENSADIARGNQDEINTKIWKTGTSYYRH